MSVERSFVVPATLDGMRVDRAVAMLTAMTRSEVAALIAVGGVHVDGSTISTPSTKLNTGSELSVDASPEVDPKDVAGDLSVEFTVVYEDGDIVVVDKPAGLVVHPGAGTPAGTLVNGLIARYPDIGNLAPENGLESLRPGIVHRLDKGTSGLMVVARSPVAYKRLVAAIAEREIHRGYTALVRGSVPDDAGLIDAPVGRSRRDRTLMAVSAEGREARTRYRVSGRFSAGVESTLLAVELESGRTHQIRVHMAALGHSIVGDRRYGGAFRAPAGSPRLSRPFLHACRLELLHPVTGAELEFHSGLPTDLAEFLDFLRSASSS